LDFAIQEVPMSMRAAVSALVLLTSFAAEAADPAHNLILFVPDGLRADMVTPATAPEMAALRDKGVAFPNSHAMFPTFTLPNSSAMASGRHTAANAIVK
jgi:predicted AlkP superfamily pyrophosphatase or phosphodiesterase